MQGSDDVGELDEWSADEEETEEVKETLMMMRAPMEECDLPVAAHLVAERVAHAMLRGPSREEHEALCGPEAAGSSTAIVPRTYEQQLRLLEPLRPDEAVPSGQEIQELCDILGGLEKGTAEYASVEGELERAMLLWQPPK